MPKSMDFSSHRFLPFGMTYQPGKPIGWRRRACVMQIKDEVQQTWRDLFFGSQDLMGRVLLDQQALKRIAKDLNGF